MTVHENTPLLPLRWVKTPLPKHQLAVVLLVLFVDSISVQYTVPFINQLIRDIGITGGDDRKIGYYAGLIDSLFYLSQALTTLHWSCLSDCIGRKPVVLIGLMALTISNMCFGLSKRFWTLILSRCIAGVLNGNMSVMKSVVGDITDCTNMAQGFAILQAVIPIGAAVGPLYGGILAKPHDHWPGLFSGIFWQKYPYFLPCIVSALLAAVVLVVAALFLKESRPHKQSTQYSQLKVSARGIGNVIPDEDTTPIPIHTLMKTHSVMVPIAVCGTFSLLDIGFFSLVPLFYATPIEIGGLGLPPSTIGMSLAAFGIVDGLFQVLFVARLIDLFGAKKVFRTAILVYFPLVALFPVMTLIVQSQKRVTQVVWIMMAIQLTLMVMVDTAYAVIFIIVTSASPNKYSLGAINGLNQTTASIARAIGPAAFTSLFAFSKQHNLFGGNAIYIVLEILTFLLVVLSRMLPDLENRGQKNGEIMTGKACSHDTV